MYAIHVKLGKNKSPETILYNCLECRPDGELLPHQIKPNLPQIGFGNNTGSNQNSGTGNTSSEFSSYSHYNR